MNGLTSLMRINVELRNKMDISRTRADNADLEGFGPGGQDG